mmetsp:Transcript_14699/g.31937  ORF Transcript_14699/g.31937 Transcript_14699/m.31937 type:complete len:102 (-) Transcript_14699:2-307(-)
MQLNMEKAADRRVTKASVSVDVYGPDPLIFVLVDEDDDDVDGGEECIGGANALQVHGMSASGAMATANVSGIEIVSFIASIRSGGKERRGYRSVSIVQEMI